MFNSQWLDRLFAIFTLILMSNGFVSLMSSDVDDILSTRESGLLVTLLLFSYSYFIIRSLFLYEKFLHAFQQSYLVVIFLLYVLIGSFLSEQSLFSIQKSIALALTIYIAVCFFVLFSKDKVVEIISTSLIILLTSSFIFGLFFPSLGVHIDDFHAGSWRGVFPQKQVLGQIALLSVIFFVTFRSNFTNKFFYAFLSLSILLLILSQSRTAWVVCFIFIAAYSYLNIQKKITYEFRTVLTVATVFILISFVYYIYLNFVDILDLLGKDPTLTGRSTLWEYTLEVAKDNRWFGVGYKAFWHNMSDLMFIYFGYFAVNSHNFVLDTYLELGLFGLLFVLLIFVSHIRQGRRQHDCELRLWSVAILLYILLVGQVATIFPNQNSLVTFLFFLSYFGLANDYKKNFYTGK